MENCHDDRSSKANGPKYAQKWQKTSKILQVSNYSENLQITKLWTAKLESEVNFRKLDEEKTNGITRSDIFMHIYVFINIYVICIYIYNLTSKKDLTGAHKCKYTQKWMETKDF